MGNGNDVPGELPEHPKLLHQLRGLLHHVLGIQAGSQFTGHCLDQFLSSTTVDTTHQVAAFVGA